jgi:chemotaxis family two-component system response regulator Rcp1
VITTSSQPESKHTVLLVEDSPTDVQIFQRALKELGKPVTLCVVRDGQEAVDFLLGKRVDAEGKNGRPHLVLLDLHLPTLSGLEVLGQLRKHPDLRSLPVVLWSTSRKVEDVRAGYLAGANSFVEKPREYERLREVLNGIFLYWFESALLLPPPAKGPQP